MFKIFTEPLQILTEREAIKLYPEKAYIFLDPEDITYIKLNEVIHDGMKGKLYAISDDTPEDIDKYYDTLNKLNQQGIYTGAFNTFKIKDAIIW